MPIARHFELKDLPDGVPATIVPPIPGEPEVLRAAGKKLEALGHQLMGDYHKYMGVKDEEVFREWTGRSRGLAEVAFGLARGRVDHGSVSLKHAGRVVVQLAADLQAAQDNHDAALTALAAIKKEQATAVVPTGGTAAPTPATDAAVKAQVNKAIAAMDQATQAHNKAGPALQALLVSESFNVSSNFIKHHPLQTIILEKMVTDGKLTKKEAEGVAAHLGKLSSRDAHIFLRLVRNAGTETHRAALYRGLEMGLTIHQLEAISTSYVNPLQRAHIKRYGRVDQGVDFTGTGEVGALGDGIITEVVASGSGWEGGGYVQYKLTSGPYAGHYIFIAEGVTPVSGLHVGQHVHAGQALVHLHGGMEMGFAAGPGHHEQSWARVFGGGYVEGQRTAAGDTFNHLLESTGQQGARVEGRAAVGHGPAPAHVPPPQPHPGAGGPGGTGTPSGSGNGNGGTAAPSGGSGNGTGGAAAPSGGSGNGTGGVAAPSGTSDNGTGGVAAPSGDSPPNPNHHHKHHHHHKGHGQGPGGTVVATPLS